MYIQEKSFFMKGMSKAGIHLNIKVQLVLIFIFITILEPPVSTEPPAYQPAQSPKY